MTLVNKFVVSGNSWNLHLLYLAIQHIIVTAAVVLMQQLGIISGVDLYNPSKARKWFPIAMMLVTMIFTGNKALQFLSVPVYTIFKNLAVVVIAYGEVIWFNGSVSPLSLVSFVLMVLSSVLAAWSDFSDAKSSATNSRLSTLNAGYFWMLINVLAASTYALGMRGGMSKIKLKNWDVIYYNNVLTIPILLGGSLFLEDWSSANLERNFPRSSPEPDHRHDLLRSWRPPHLLLHGLVHPGDILHHLRHVRCAQQAPHGHRRPRLLQGACNVWWCRCHPHGLRERRSLLRGQDQQAKGEDIRSAPHEPTADQWPAPQVNGGPGAGYQDRALMTFSIRF
uniref:GDP-mannose transporter n=1 Tax=Bionectria ochroleuca TaxID=29856 RepID=A0A8H7NHC9_BIOOC